MTDKPLIYLDNAATTPLRKEALDAMLPYLTHSYGNPSGVYKFARDVRKAVEEAREQIAAALGAQAGEIVFTASGTEANNWAIGSTIEANIAKGGHIITSAIEHHAVTHVCDKYKSHGAEVTYLPVNAEGIVSPDDLRAAIRPDTILITIMWANNEVGTIQPIAELSAIAREKGIAFHTDAVQAVGHIPVDLQECSGISLLTLSAHKFGGPKGIGALYIRKGTRLTPFVLGGAQEKNRRAGTENVAGIIGMAAAITQAVIHREAEYKRISGLRDTLIKRITEEIPNSSLNGARGENRLPGNINCSFDYIEGESLLLLLDMHNICASSGSACSSASMEPSHVLLALGVPLERAHGSIRFSLGSESAPDDIVRLMEVLPKFVKQLRAMSPLAEQENL